MAVLVYQISGDLPEPPKSYIESFMSLTLSYRRKTPPDELTRELAYRMLRQRMALLKVVERENIYVVALQRKSVVVFEIYPPEHNHLPEHDKTEEDKTDEGEEAEEGAWVKREEMREDNNNGSGNSKSPVNGKFNGWRYRTIRNLQDVPVEVLKEVVEELSRLIEPE